MVQRRKFIKGAISGTVALSGIGLSGFTNAHMNKDNPSSLPALEKDTVILFQGDSITDCGWSREEVNPNSELGRGYVALAASRLLRDYPSKNISIYNRGVGGRRLYQLHDCWQEDCIDLKPNILSILIGVNDFHARVSGSREGYDRTIDTFEDDFRTLLNRTIEALPNIKFIIGEPYGVANTRVVNELWPSYEFIKYREVSKRIAKEFDSAFVPFHSDFEIVAEKYENPEYWSYDGIHPTMAGAQLMADSWLKALKKII